jgi:UDPglucose 6-dehydrogenase
VRVAVVGQGYVGLTASTGLASAGHDVVGVECAPDRLEALRNGRAPFYEPGLAELLERVVATGRLAFARSLAEVDGHVSAVVVAVATPTDPEGSCDLTQVDCVLEDVLGRPEPPELVVLKSTVPPGTSEERMKRPIAARYVYSPEFLNQGNAVEEWRRPARVVAGLWNEELLPALRELFRGVEGPWVVTTPTDAEMIKYASNAFLATRTSFINEVANLCDRVGADVARVVEGIGLDPRIGSLHWFVGCGYGDSCLSKDVQALIHRAGLSGYSPRLLQAVQDVNSTQRLRPLRLVRAAVDGSPGEPALAVLGLAFEPHSDDVRYAPSRLLVPEFLELVQDVRVWDPLLPSREIARLFPGTTACPSVEDAVRGAGVVLALTEYPEVRRAEWAALAPTIVSPRLVVDAKNCLDAAAVLDAGLDYRGLGRQAWVGRYRRERGTSLAAR